MNLVTLFFCLFHETETDHKSHLLVNWTTLHFNHSLVRKVHLKSYCLPIHHTNMRGQATLPTKQDKQTPTDIARRRIIISYR